MSMTPPGPREIRGDADNWMVRLGLAARGATKVVVKNFSPTTFSLSFVRSLCSQNDMSATYLDGEVVLERQKSSH